MYQIDNSTAATTQPASTVAGTPGFFTDGNPATSTPATIVPAEWLNAVMMELSNVVTGAGLTLAKNQFSQVLTAIKTLMQQSVSSVAIDTGSANAYVVAFTPALGAPVPWAPFWFKVKTTNTGASTLNATGTPYGLVGGAHQALQGSELVANGNALVYWNPTLNSGAGQYVLVFCSGAAEQVAPATQSQHAAQLGQIGHGQCRLSVVSGTQLKLAPYNGNNLIINGVPQAIPGSGVTISNASLSNSTTYYAYVYMNAGVMTLELSTTTYAANTSGIVQKSGDATRTLVGMIRTTATGTFADSTSQLFCLNWFNRRSKRGVVQTLSDQAFTNNSMAEVSTSMRIEFLVWNNSIDAVPSNDAGMIIANGTLANNTSGGQTTFQVYVDGAVFSNQTNASISGTTMNRVPFSCDTGITGLSEGYHLATLYGATSSTSSSTLIGGSNHVLQIFG